MIKLLAATAVVCAAVAVAGFAQDSEDAMRLYNQGVKLLDQGKGDSALETFKTIIEKYPNSAYARLAREGLEKPIIASIEFRDLKPLSEKEVRKHLEMSNAGLRVGRAYDPEFADQAKTLIAQMMVKKKVKAKDISVTTREEPGKKVAVIITVIH